MQGNNMPQRNPMLDAARGIAMLLVVLGHSFYSFETPLNLMIMSFHMPLFFILSGLLAKREIESSDKLRSIIQKKIKIFLIPQITLGVITLLYDTLFFVVIKHNPIESIDFFYCFWRWWFLQVLLGVVILFDCLAFLLPLDKIRVKLVILIITLLVSFGAIVFRDHFPDESIGYLNVLPIGFLFYYIGFLSKKNVLKQKYISKNSGLLFFLSVPMLFIISNFNTPVTMFNNNYGNIVLFLVSVPLGVYAVMFLAEHCKQSKFLSYIGVNSIAIYVWQFKVDEFMKNISQLISNRLHLGLTDSTMTMLSFILSLIVLVPLVNLTMKYIPEIYGNKKIIITEKS
jgi:acyltransferase